MVLLAPLPLLGVEAQTTPAFASVLEREAAQFEAPQPGHQIIS